MTSEPAPNRAPQSIAQPQQPPRYEESRPRREPPVRIIPQYAERQQPPVVTPVPARPARSVPPAAAYVDRAPIAVLSPAQTARIEVEPYGPPPQPVAVDVPRQAPSVAGAAVIEVPGEIQTGDGLVTVHPNLRPDPAWKLCQIDSRDLGRRTYRCTAYSYHPYGEGGYRPYGTYRNYPTAPGYVTAPNAKIIRIEPY
jgi:hypothetical protein